MGCGTSKPKEIQVIPTIVPPNKIMKENKAKSKSGNLLEPPGVNLLEGPQKPVPETMSKKNHMKQCFDEFDKDNDGSIDLSEFLRMCRKLGLYISDSVCRTQFKIFNNYGNTLSFSTFMDWYQTDAQFKLLDLNDEELKCLDKIHDHFIKFDKDRSGHIDSLEFNRFYDDLLAKVTYLISF